MNISIGRRFLNLFFMICYGIVSYSPQILGFYVALQIMNASIWKIWVVVIGTGLRFLLQVSIVWVFIWKVLKYKINFKEVKLAFIPLLIGGISSTILRGINYFLWNSPYFTSLRLNLEFIIMTAGWFSSIYLLGRSIDSNTYGKIIKYLVVLAGGAIAYIIFPPI